MKVTIHHGHQIPQEAQGLSVVIDVLRAFTTAAFAFSNGAKEIIFVSTIEEAFALHKNDPSTLLMGEVNGRTVEGFHFGNSPKEIKNASLTGRRLIQRTSSGTQGVVGSAHAQYILAASFVTAEATLKRILQLKPSHVSLLATGRNNGDEDLALAEYLKARLENSSCSLDHNLNRVRNSPVASRLLHGEIAYSEAAEDIELATTIDHFSFAIEVFKEGSQLIGRAVRAV